MVRMIPSVRMIAVLSLLFAAPAMAQDDSANDIDWKKGAWGDLSPYIGTYDYDAVLNDERVAAALEKQLGADMVATLTDTMQTRAPIGFQDDCLLLSGNAPASADTNAAFIAVCVYQGVVHTALQKSGDITLFTAATKYDYLPYGMKLWIYGQTNRDVLKLPDGVSLRLAP